MDVGAASAALVVVMVNHGRGSLYAGVPIPLVVVTRFSGTVEVSPDEVVLAFQAAFRSR